MERIQEREILTRVQSVCHKFVFLEPVTNLKKLKIWKNLQLEPALIIHAMAKE